MNQTSTIDEQLAKLEEQFQQMLPDCPYEMVQEGRTAAAVAVLARISPHEQQRYGCRIEGLLASVGIVIGRADTPTGTS